MSCSGHFWQSTVLPGLLMMGLTGCSGLPKMPAPLTLHRAKAPQMAPLAAAQQQERDGQLEAARQAYVDLVTADPANAVAWHRLGVVFTRLGDATSAAHSYNAALSLRPHDTELLTDAGYSCLLRGEHAAAEQLLVTALQYNPQSPRATQNLALTLGLAGRMDESLAIFEKVHPRPQALTNLAYVYQLRGDMPRALACYETAHQQDARIAIPATLMAKASPSATTNSPQVQTAAASLPAATPAPAVAIQPASHVASPILPPPVPQSATVQPASLLENSQATPTWQPLSPPPARLPAAVHELEKPSLPPSSSRALIDEPRVLKARSVATPFPAVANPPAPTTMAIPPATFSGEASSQNPPRPETNSQQTNVFRSQSPTPETITGDQVAATKILASGRSGPPSPPRAEASSQPFEAMTSHTLTINEDDSAAASQTRTRQNAANDSSMPPLPLLPTVQPGWKLEGSRETFGMVIHSLQNDRPTPSPRRLSTATVTTASQLSKAAEPTTESASPAPVPSPAILPARHTSSAETLKGETPEAVEVAPVNEAISEEETTPLTATEASANEMHPLTTRNACLVTLRNDRQLVAGQPDLNAPHYEQSYSFASSQAAEEFRSAPERFVPAAGGLDVVGVRAGTSVREGQFKNAAWYRERLYLFSSPEHEQQFRQEPTIFAQASSQP